MHDLERAKRTVKDLSDKLKTVTTSKQSAVAAAESVKQQARELENAKPKTSTDNSFERNWEVENEREQYKKVYAELDAQKQELNKIRQDFAALLETKEAGLQQAAEARRLGKTSSERCEQLQKEISAMKEAFDQVKTASQQALEEQGKLIAERDSLELSFKAAKETALQKLSELQKEYDPDATTDLELKFAATTKEVEELQEQMKQAHAAEMDAMRIVTSELNDATRALQKVADEESLLRNQVNLLRQEVDVVKREYAQLKKEEEMRIAEEKERENAMLKKFTSEEETAKREIDEINKIVEDLRKGTEAAQIKINQAETALEMTHSLLVEAKAAEQRAIEDLNILKVLPESDSASKINIKKEDYESMKSKVENSGPEADKKLEECNTQVEQIKTSKMAADQKVEAGLKALEEIKTATEIAIKSAETAAAAQTMVEGELRRWRKQEQTA